MQLVPSDGGGGGGEEGAPAMKERLRAGSITELHLDVENAYISTYGGKPLLVPFANYLSSDKSTSRSAGFPQVRRPQTGRR